MHAASRQVALSHAALPDLLRCEPMSKHEMMARGQGPYAAARAAACQTRVHGQDVCEAEAQSEPPDAADAACQAPDGGGGGGGSGCAADAAAAGQRDRRRARRRRGGAGGGQGPAGGAAAPVERGRLAGFMEWAAEQVLAELSRSQQQSAGWGLAGGGDSSQASEGSYSSGAPQHGLAISAGARTLEWAPLLAGRRAVAACFPPPPALGAPAAAWEGCVAYRPVARPRGRALTDHSLAGRGMLAVWDARTPGGMHGSSSGRSGGTAGGGGGGPPAALLLSEGAPAACCYGAGACGGVVIAATEDGAVCAWDLGERPSRAWCDLVEAGGAEIWGRRPSFSSEASALSDVISPEPPVAVSAVAPRAGGQQATGGGGGAGGGGSCSVVVLGAWGRVSVWTARLLGAAEAAVAEADPGVRPGAWGLGRRLARGRATWPPSFGR